MAGCDIRDPYLHVSDTSLDAVLMFIIVFMFRRESARARVCIRAPTRTCVYTHVFCVLCGVCVCVCVCARARARACGWVCVIERAHVARKCARVCLFRCLSSSELTMGEGDFILSGTMNDGFEQSDWVCLENGCFELLVSGGSAESEISFEFMDEEGNHFQDLAAPYSDHFCCTDGDVFDHPTPAPSPLPSISPAPSASPRPTPVPTILPTIAPSPGPTVVPSVVPTALPSIMPTPAPSPVPTTALCTWAPTYSSHMCAGYFGGTCYSSEVRSALKHCEFTSRDNAANIYSCSFVTLKKDSFAFGT